MLRAVDKLGTEWQHISSLFRGKTDRHAQEKYKQLKRSGRKLRKEYQRQGLSWKVKERHFGSCVRRVSALPHPDDQSFTQYPLTNTALAEENKLGPRLTYSDTKGMHYSKRGGIAASKLPDLISHGHLR